MIEPISEFLIDMSLVAVFFGAVFYIPYRIEKPKKILRQLKYLSGRSSNSGCITVFDLATETEISPQEAKKALDKYIQELEGEKLVSAKGEVYYVFPRGEKIFKEETQLQLESATDRKINRLEEQIAKLQKQIESDK
jgi:polyhydroxyalkanoate synthesis regulator phasin